MPRLITAGALAVALFAGAVLAQEGVQRGKVKSIDVERLRLTLTVGGKDRDLTLDETTRVLDAKGDTLRERLQGFKPGAEVFFKLGKKGDKSIVAGLKLAGPAAERAQPRADTTKLKPLTELGSGKYQGYAGGLYPDGKNERPAAHQSAGLRLARQVVPRDADGKPSPTGKIVLLSVGMSNTHQVSMGFQRLLAEEKGLHPRLVFVDGAQGGMTAAAIQDPGDGRRGTQYWKTVDERLKKAGVTAAQVQAVWIKQADAGPTEGFPGYARKLEKELANIVRVLPRRFPNVRLTYLSSRTYGGYARTPLNPEPYAFESGFSVKWLIERQIKGEAELSFDKAAAPWLSWGPYLWANGGSKRADGFAYAEEDFANDGTHLSPSGMKKTGQLLVDFFKSDATAKSWFLRGE